MKRLFLNFRYTTILVSMLFMATNAISGNTQRYAQNLFTGAFSEVEDNIQSDKYILQVGDEISIKTWGAIDKDISVVVDPNGFVFIEKIGAVSIVGLELGKLGEYIESRMHKYYSEGVNIYTTLKKYKRIKVFVSGQANNPGIYMGSSGDTVLNFIDRAKGISNDGSYRKVDIIRDTKNIATVDLYKYMRTGEKPKHLLQNGDIVHVNSLTTEVLLELPEKAIRYELNSKTEKMSTLMGLSSILNEKKKVEITSYAKNGISRRVVNLESPDTVLLKDGDIIKLIPNKNITDVLVSVMMEETGKEVKIVLSKGSTLGYLIKMNADMSWYDVGGKVNTLRLYRESEKIRQKDQYRQYADSIRRMALTRISDTSSIASLASSDSTRLTSFADKIEKSKPSGNVIVDYDNLDLFIIRDGDRIVIPAKPTTVSVNGSVMVPNTYAYSPSKTIKDYIAMSGGMINDADRQRVIIKRFDSTIVIADLSNDQLCLFGCKKKSNARPGDEVFIIPATVSNVWEYSKELIQIIYQVAASSRIFI